MLNRLLITALLALLGQSHAQATAFTDSQLILLLGFPVGDLNDLAGYWDGSLNSAETDTNFNMVLDSNSTIIGIDFDIHHIRVFGPGQYQFDTACTIQQIESGLNDCGGTIQQMTVAAGQIGAHAHVDAIGYTDIDFVVVWEPDQVYDNGTKVWDFATVDGNNDGFPGIPIVEGILAGIGLNINLTVAASDIYAEVTVTGGSVQECDAHGGNTRNVSLNTYLPDTDTLESADWFLDGVNVGNNLNEETIFFPLGQNELQIDITSTNGATFSSSQTIVISDRTRPTLTADLIPVFEGSQRHTLVVDISDVCDPNPAVVSSDIGLDIAVGAEVDISNTANKVAFETPEFRLRVSGRDESSNSTTLYKYYQTQ